MLDGQELVKLYTWRRSADTWSACLFDAWAGASLCSCGSLLICIHGNDDEFFFALFYLTIRLNIFRIRLFHWLTRFDFVCCWILYLRLPFSYFTLRFDYFTIILKLLCVLLILDRGWVSSIVIVLSHNCRLWGGTIRGWLFSSLCISRWHLVSV